MARRLRWAVAWPRRFGGWVARWVAALHPAFAVSDRLRREILGLVLALLAALSGWSLGSGGDDGRLVDWWENALGDAFGRAAPLAAVFLVLIAVRAFRPLDGPVLLARHYLGGFAFGVAVAGLLHLGARVASDRAGGYLGAGAATVLLSPFGEVASGVVLFAAGVVGVFLLADTDAGTFYRELRTVFGRARESASREDAESDEETEAVNQPEPVARPELRWSSLPDAAVAVVEPAGPPVINLPKRDPKSAIRTGLLPNPPGRAKLGAALPLPDIARLALYDGFAHDPAELERKARRIEETLASFKVEARVREINPGPAVTQFALEPGNGVKVRRISELQNDLALAMAAKSLRIEAPIPGEARVGLEIPNAQVSTVGLRETLESNQFAKSKAKLPLPLGRDVNGRYVVHDLTKMPHLLIAGATGSGKSVCLNGIISTFLLTRTPDDVKLLMIDPKMVELTGYNGVPHLQCPVVTEMDKVVGVLRLVLREMERRYNLFSRLGVRNLDGYRAKVADEPGAENLPYLVVIIDELADLMMTTPEEVESLLVRLAQMARATGIHLIIATQRPSVDVVTGLIKANVPARIAFAVSSRVNSQVVLDMPGAERLVGKGDMLFLPPDAPKPVRIQGAFLEDADVQGIVDHWHAVAPVPQYAEEWLNLPGSGDDAEGGGDDPLMEQALEIVQKHGTASASMLQRRLRVGYNRAARLIEQMEDDGVIGPAEGGLKGRPVLTVDE